MPMSVLVSREYADRFFYINLTGKRGTTTTYVSRIPVSMN